MGGICGTPEGDTHSPSPALKDKPHEGKHLEIDVNARSIKGIEQSPSVRRTETIKSKPFKESDLNNRYIVFLNIKKGRHLKPPQQDDSIDDRADALVVAQIGGASRHTRYVPFTEKPAWDESLCFQFRTKPTTELVLHLKCNQHLKYKHVASATIPTHEFLWDGHSYHQSKHLSDDNGKIKIEFVTSVISVDEIERMSVIDYSHVIRFTIHSTKLSDNDQQKDTKLRIRVKWGRNNFETRSSRKGKWEQSCVVFAKTYMKSWLLKVSLYDVHEKVENSSGFLKFRWPVGMDDEQKDAAARDVSAIGDEREFKDGLELKYEEEELPQISRATTLHAMKDYKIDLFEGVNDLDIRIRNIVEGLDQEAPSRGSVKPSTSSLKLSVQFLSREDFETNMYSSICLTTGTKKDAIDSVEMASLLYEVCPGADVEHWMETMDKNKDGSIDMKELKTFIQSAVFRCSPYLWRVVSAYLTDWETDSKQLMKKIPEDQKSTIYVQDRETGLVVTEKLPDYNRRYLELMFSSAPGRFFTGILSDILTKKSVKKGEEYGVTDKDVVKTQIDDYIKTFNVNLEEVEYPEGGFRTMNDFFARPLKKECRPIAAEGDNRVVVSAADCRMMVFSSITDSTKFWIKGSAFNVKNLFGKEFRDLVSLFENGSLIIHRLAPQDYHKWHWPVSGTVNRISEIKGKLYSVNPLAINRPVNVYTENKRALVEILTEEFGQVVLVSVGATLVGSCVIFDNEQNIVSNGNDINYDGQVFPVHKGHPGGEFRYGGSTVLLLFQKHRVKFSRDLVTCCDRTEHSFMETYVRVNTEIGKAI